jgi:CheY-like chemotaxis protein
MTRSISDYTSGPSREEQKKGADRNEEKGEKKGLPASPGSIRRIQSSPAIPRKGQVLLAEDSFLQRKIEKAFIEKAGYQCDTAATLREAITKLKANNYNRVVSDHNLDSETAQAADEREFVRQMHALLFPGGTPTGAAEGILLMEYIQNHLANEERASTLIPRPVLISAVSGVTEDQLRHYANERGAHFIPKPVKLEQLQTALDNPFTLPDRPTSTPPGEVEGDSLPTSHQNAGAGTTPTVTAPTMTTTSATRREEGKREEGKIEEAGGEVVSRPTPLAIPEGDHNSDGDGYESAGNNDFDEGKSATTVPTISTLLSNPFSRLTLLTRQETTPATEEGLQDFAPSVQDDEGTGSCEDKPITEAGEPIVQ